MLQKSTDSSFDASLNVNDENQEKIISDINDFNSNTHPSGRSKRRCVIEQEQSRSKSFIDEDFEYIPIPVPKKEPVAGRKRGRPPLKQYVDTYVFSTRLANTCASLMSLGFLPAVITEWHKKCIRPNSILNHETIRSAVDYLAKIRSSTTQHPQQIVSEHLQAPSHWQTIPANAITSTNSPSIFTHIPPGYIGQPNMAQFPPQYFAPYHQDPSVMPFHFHPIQQEIMINMGPSRYQTPISQTSSAGPPPLQALSSEDRTYMMNEYMAKERQQHTQ